MKVSVVVCTYSPDLVPDTVECINSLLDQDYPDKEILLVMDRNEELYKILQNSVPESVKIVINETPGLSSARNTGIQHASGEVIAFIDDDATASPEFLPNLMKNYNDPSVIGVGGKILPKGKPAYPEELYWIGGFTYEGHPEQRCSVRNVLGCNMSFREEAFRTCGAFKPDLGRTGRKLVTAEETEFSLRVHGSFPDRKILYCPEAVVYHKVHHYRENFKYIIKRSFFEGFSKASIKQLHSDKNSFESETNYLKFLLMSSVPLRLRKIVCGQEMCESVKEGIQILSAIGFVGLGYLKNRTDQFLKLGCLWGIFLLSL